MNKSLKKETSMSPLPTIDEENLFNQKVWTHDAFRVFYSIVSKGLIN